MDSAAIRSASALAPAMMRGRFGLGLLLLGLVLGEQLLGLFLQAARFVEVGLHALGAIVERAGQHLRHADIDRMPMKITKPIATQVSASASMTDPLSA